MTLAGKDKVKEVVTDKILDDLSNSGLSQKEQDFILYYLESNNITQSCLKVYGGDKKTASVRGHAVMLRPKVQTELKRMKKLMSMAYDIEPTKYLETLLKIANSDIGDYIKFSEEEVPIIGPDGIPMVNPDTGEPIVKKVNKMHLEDSDFLDTSIITEIKQGKDGISIKFPDKLKAWEKLKDFFDWKNKVDDDDSGKNNLLEVLDAKVDSVWAEDADSDLEVLNK